MTNYFARTSAYPVSAVTQNWHVQTVTGTATFWYVKMKVKSTLFHWFTCFALGFLDSRCLYVEFIQSPGRDIHILFLSRSLNLISRSLDIIISRERLIKSRERHYILRERLNQTFWLASSLTGHIVENGGSTAELSSFKNGKHDIIWGFKVLKIIVWFPEDNNSFPQ